MQSKATANTTNKIDNHGRQSHSPTFAKVLNGSKRPIRGLWIRNGRYYAQLRVEDLQTGIKKTRRIPLLDKDGQAGQSLAEAQVELRELLSKRHNNKLPMLRENPKLDDYAEDYLKWIGTGQGAKRPATVKKEKGALKLWRKKFGQMRIGQIRRFHVNEFLKERLATGKSPRTANLDVTALRNVLSRALDEQRIAHLPMEGMKPLKTTTVKRPFFNAADLAKLCQAAFLTKVQRDKRGEVVRDEEGKPVQIPLTKNAQEFVDYVRLMAYSGTRRNEALALRWHDVDFEAGQLIVGAAGDTKNRTPRVIDFNSRLKLHLFEMHRRRAPDSQWLFPSPQRGSRDVPVKTFRESLDLVRQKAEMPNFQFHDCRHHFISMCVMAGVDFMTIASWVGHKDGGILIGKVYGHLANEHRKRMAERVAFEPVIVPAAAATQ
jgi:integrase